MELEHILWMALDLTLGICLKLMCDNGRVHWRDFANDTLFWVPGFQQLPGDGLSRSLPPVEETEETEETELPLAAK